MPPNFEKTGPSDSTRRRREEEGDEGKREKRKKPKRGKLREISGGNGGGLDIPMDVVRPENQQEQVEAETEANTEAEAQVSPKQKEQEDRQESVSNKPKKEKAESKKIDDAFAEMEIAGEMNGELRNFVRRGEPVVNPDALTPEQVEKRWRIKEGKTRKGDYDLTEGEGAFHVEPQSINRKEVTKESQVKNEIETGDAASGDESDVKKENETGQKVEGVKTPGWRGNWNEGDRPEGYVDISEKLRRYEREGIFSPLDELNLDELMERGDLLRFAKGGKLSYEEKDRLVEYNKRLFNAMKEIEEEEKMAGEIGFGEGDKVTVERSNGEIEKDWIVAGHKIDRNSGELVVIVKKADPQNHGMYMTKEIYANEFERLNPRGGKNTEVKEVIKNDEQRLSIGDTVQVVGSEADQFSEPRNIIDISDDGQWAFLEGTSEVYPFRELRRVSNGAPKQPLSEKKGKEEVKKEGPKVISRRGEDPITGRRRAPRDFMHGGGMPGLEEPSLTSEKIIRAEMESAEATSDQREGRTPEDKEENPSEEPFDVQQAVRERPEFVDFLADKNVDYEKVISNPEESRKLFRAFEVKEQVVEGIENLIGNDLEEVLGISIEDENIQKQITESINKRAIENPESLIKIGKQLKEFNSFGEEIKILEERANAATSGGFTEKLEQLKVEQQKLSKTEKYGKFATWRSPALIGFVDFVRNTVKDPFYLKPENRKSTTGFGEIKKQMGMKGWSAWRRALPTFGSVGKYAKIELEKLNKEIDEIQNNGKPERFQELMEEAKKRHANARNVIIEGVGISASLRDIGQKKIKEQLKKLSTPKKTQDIESLDFYEERAQKFLDEMASHPLSFLTEADTKELQGGVDNVMELAVARMLGREAALLNKEGAKHYGQFEKVIDDIMSREKIGTKSSEDIRKFLIDTLNGILKETKESGNKRSSEVSLALLIKKLEQGARTT